MVAPDDWRIDFAKGLKGYSFRWKRYYRWSEEWDHDHCAACAATFALGYGLEEGFAVTEEYPHGADYDWVCKECFDDLREIMGWRVVE
jgi:hypothetical protein